MLPSCALYYDDIESLSTGAGVSVSDRSVPLSNYSSRAPSSEAVGAYHQPAIVEGNNIQQWGWGTIIQQ